MHLRRLAGAAIFVAVVLALVLSGIGTTPPQQPKGPTFTAVQQSLATGTGVRLSVQLLGADGTPLREVPRVLSAQLDMAPDGMPTMRAELTPAVPERPGEIAFTADLPMAGRWALTLSAVPGGSTEGAVNGTVVFTVSEAAGKERAAPARTGRILYYRHPMGLPDFSKTPRKDSMGMDYIPVYEGDVADGAAGVRIAPEKVQRAGVRTEIVQQRRLTRTIRAPATVIADESRIAVLTAKFEGFVEQLLVPVTGAEVAAGQPLVRIWIENREILQKQSDLLAALRANPRRPGDIERTEANLRMFGIPDAAIESLRASGEPVRVLTLTAAIGGTVVDKPAMNGARFGAGDRLYRIVDLSKVWVMAQVAERDLPFVRMGQKVLMSFASGGDVPVEAEVSFIYPELDMATRTVPVRIVVDNAARRLRLGQYAEVAIEAEPGDRPVVAIPESAVIDSGRRRVAFVDRGEGLFEPRDLVLGVRGNGFVEVRSGLAAGERIVVTGNFLIDAESNLRAALQGFTAPEPPR